MHRARPAPNLKPAAVTLAEGGVTLSGVTLSVPAPVSRNGPPGWVPVARIPAKGSAVSPPAPRCALLPARKAEWSEV